MSTEVDLSSSVEPHGVKMSGGTTTSAASTTGPKVSMFGAKSGFVIPKNKLSGSLVPIFRGSNKQKDSGKANEDNAAQVHRKTKWGPDLTQDAAVRKGRALAYQTRVDQITQQLKSGSLEVADNQESPSEAQRQNDKSSSDQIESETPELLELERREIIGEILKLNPSYKAPSDYKPLLKEARVPIPVNQYPGYNFVSLIYGPGSDTKKRLEKETGSKIQVYGTTKGYTGEKIEVSPPVVNETVVAYEELHVLVSAETFEKVDAAVALIEMLLNSVSGNLVPVSTSTSVSGDNVNALTTAPNQGLLQPGAGPTQATLENQFQYPSPWFQPGPPQTSMYPPSGFIPPPNSSAPYLNNPSNTPSHFGPRPNSSTGFNSIHQNPSFLPPRPHQPSQGLQNPYTPQAHPLGPPVPVQSSSAPPTMLAQPPFTGSQVPPPGPHLSGRPFMQPQPGSNALPGPPPTGRWPGAPGGPTVSMGPPATNVSTSPAFFPSRPQLQSPSVNRPPFQVFSSGPAPPPIQSSQSVMSVASANNPSVNPALGSGHYPSPIQSGMPGSISTSTPNYAPGRPPQMPMPKPQLPSPGDFTFQPNQSQNPSQPFPRLTSHHIQNVPPSNSMMQPSAPQGPSFQFSVHNQMRPQIGNQMGQQQAPRSAVPFHGNLVVGSGPPRLPAFQNAGPTNPIPQMGPRDYGHQMPNFPGSFPPRSLQNFPGQTVRPGNYMPPNQQFNSSHSIAPRPRGQQSYDLFLPTSGSIAPQQQRGGNVKVSKQENDIEYEDLMASVGVK